MPVQNAASTKQAAVAPTELNYTLDHLDAAIIKRTLEQCGGDTSKAAHRLGISRSRIYRLLGENDRGERLWSEAAL